MDIGRLQIKSHARLAQVQEPGRPGGEARGGGGVGEELWLRCNRITSQMSITRHSKSPDERRHLDLTSDPLDLRTQPAGDRQVAEGNASAP